MIEVLDLFSAAAGGWSLGMHRAGFTTTAACEVEAWRRALYSENNPNVKVYDDVRTLTADRLLADLGRLPSVVVGSPPCQDISSANTKGRGVEGERSGLYFEAVRLIGECRPRWFALENSANLRTRGADAVIAALEAIGYTCWPFVVRAGDIDANHERPRAWLIGCDLAQVADPGIAVAEWGAQDGGRSGRPEGAERKRPVGCDLQQTQLGDAAQDGCGSGFSGRCVEPIERLPIEACGDARHANIESSAARVCAASREGPDAYGTGRLRPGAEHGRSRSLPTADTNSIGRSAHGKAGGPWKLGEANGPSFDRAYGPCDDADPTGERSPGGEIQWQDQEPERADVSPRREMGVCAPDSGDTVGGGPLWSLADFADHLRLDDGLSARLAGHRIDIGDGKGQSAASLIVEAFGDAVIPQIPEAIGRAILRTEQALAVIYGKLAA